MLLKNILLHLSFGMHFLSALPKEKDGGLTLRFEGIEQPGGTVRLALYSAEAQFMQEDKAVLYNFKVNKKGILEGSIEKLPAGSYAFAVFLDENDNMELDKNLFGVPTEPYGFSQTPASKWRLPKWEEVKFEHGAKAQVIVVSLKRWALL